MGIDCIGCYKTRKPRELLILAFALVIVAAFLVGVTSARAAAGDLDPSFGTGGLVTTDFGDRGDFALALATQQDGKIVVAGNSSTLDFSDTDFALARYNPDGGLDATFGGGGTVLSDFGSSIDAAFDVVIQSDGKVVAAGTSSRDFAVARYRSDGSLDSTFGNGGLVTTDFGSFDQATALTLQPDGKLVAVGVSVGDFTLARYNSDGSLDTSFGSGGKVLTDFGSFDQAFDVAVTTGGKIVVGGRTGGDFALAQYEANGSLDASFGSGGKVTTNFGGTDQAFAIALDSAGRITAAGTASYDFALARYNSDGSSDASFGSSGTVTPDFSFGSVDTAFGVVVQSDGRITAGGGTGAAAGSSFALARYTSNGSLDLDFGSGGTVTTTFGHARNNANDIALQADGKVVAAGGTAELASPTDFALARYLGTPTTITVAVDVKPGSADNVVPLQSAGVVSVAILNELAQRACTEKHNAGHLEDVNWDGRVDLLLHYDVGQTGIDPGDTKACLTGKTYAGVAIEGCDRISTR